MLIIFHDDFYNLFFFHCYEAYFYLTLHYNKQSNRYWADSAQECSIEVPLNDKKLLVWCAISTTRAFGPYYFESTVNSANYLQLMETFFPMLTEQ